MPNCNSCPRQCNANRITNFGYCKAPSLAVVARVGLHFFEEPCICGSGGSGTIFFSGCNMRCVFCQNYEISSEIKGKQLDVNQLCEQMLKLQEKGAVNINLVTPSHYVDIISEALRLIKGKQLTIPVVYNTNSYDSEQSLSMLNGLVDIYLADIKYMNDTYAQQYSATSNYVKTATSAVMEMKRQQPFDIFEGQMLVKGIVIRHLVLPLLTDDSIKVIDFIADKLGVSTIVSVMSQYFPPREMPLCNLNRRLTKREYDKVANYFLSKGFTNGYFQSLSSAIEDYVPNFDVEKALL